MWISVPVDALSKTDSTVVYYDPSQLRDTITQPGQDKERKVGTGAGESEMPRSLSVSQRIS